MVPLIKVLLWADSLESYLKPTILIKSYCIAKYEPSIVFNSIYRVSQKSVRLQEGRSVHKRTLFLGHLV